MDDDTRDLVRQLCARAGLLMEDASLVAVTMPVRDAACTATKLRSLTADAACAQALLIAAASLLARELQPMG